MTRYELASRVAAPFMPPLTGLVRRELRSLARSGEPQPRVLDVGGRRSPYTANLPMRVVISDLPRASERQHRLDLGMSENVESLIRRRRSNVDAVLIDDMTRTELPGESFDGVIAIEVLEHVADDSAFVANVANVLRPGGWFFMTTPNGERFPIPSEDHVRHYVGSQLTELLESSFASVEVFYGVPTGRTTDLSRESWDLRRPAHTMKLAAAGFIAQRRALRPTCRTQAMGTRHLIAVARVNGD